MKSEKKSYLKEISFIALPIIIQGMVFQIQLLVNRAFLGRIEVKYLSVLGNITFPYQAPMEAILAISIGLTIVISRNLGAGKYKEIDTYFNSSLIYNIFASLSLFFIWNISSKLVFNAIGVDKSLLGYCAGYVKITSIYLLLFGFDTTIQAALQGIGRTKPIMYAGIFKVIMNIALDWILIFGNLGFPRMGLYGSALASTIANSLSTILLIVYIFFTKNIYFKIRISELIKPKWARYKEVVCIGLPTGMEYFCWQFGAIMLTKLLNSLDKIAVGVYTLIFTIEVLVYMVFNGVAKACLTLMGYKLGRKEENEALAILLASIKYALAVVITFSILFCTFPKSILSIFTDDMNVIKSAVLYFIIIALAMIPKSINVVVGSGIRALGNTKWMLYTQVFGTLFVIICSYTLVNLFGVKIIAVYISIFADETVRAILNSIHLYKSSKNNSKKSILT
jgi:putative MATE family efflux protein